MKISLFSIVFCFLFISCDKKDKIEINVEKIPLTIEIQRFDKLFFETKPEDLPSIKLKFPFFFPKNTPDSIWLNKMQNPQWRELYSEVQKKYSNIKPVQNKLETLFKHIKYYFPKKKTPKVITVVSEMDYNNKVIYTDSLLIISLELYLGKNHKFYQFPEYLKRNFEENQMMPDVVSSFSSKVILPVSDKDFISKIIYSGKQLYIKDKLLPDCSDAEKIGYTTDQINWCKENESYIWRYFIEKELLFSNDQKLISRFINPAPFSKFYLEIDNESPGRVGTWIGWQMVRSFMNNNDISLQELLNTSTQEIFKKSKYKPKK